MLMAVDRTASDLERTEGYDAVLVGHRNLSRLNRLAVGIGSERRARGCPTPVVQLPRS